MDDPPRCDDPTTPGGTRVRTAGTPRPGRPSGDRPPGAPVTPSLWSAAGGGGGFDAPRDDSFLASVGRRLSRSGAGGRPPTPGRDAQAVDVGSWDAAVARMGSPAPGLLRRLTSPRPPGPGDYAVLDMARAESVRKERLMADAREVAPKAASPDAGLIDAAAAAEVDVEAAEKAALKEEKELKKKIKDFMKTSLSSERTFFKWVWAGLNLGALGTFALVFFRDEGFPYRLIVVGVAWTMALTSALYGLRQFHRRRRALLSVVDDPETWESPHAPALVVAAFVTMMLTLIVYAIASGQQFGFQDKASDASAAPDQ